MNTFLRSAAQPSRCRNLRNPRREGGYVLLFVLVAMMAAIALAPSLLRYVGSRAGASAKAERQDAAVAEMETRYATLRSQMRAALATGQDLDMSGRQLGGALDSSDANVNYSVMATITSDAGVIPSVPPLGGFTLATYAGQPDPPATPADMADDPFYKAPAAVWPLSVAASLEPRATPGSNLEPAAMDADMRLIVRSFPASAFTVASWANLTLGSAFTEEGCGRVYAKGAVVVSAPNIVSSARLVAGGGLIVGTDGSLVARASADSPALTMPAGSSTETDAWLSQNFAWSGGVAPVVSGRTRPAALIRIAGAGTMFAEPEDPIVVEAGGTAGLEQQKFQRQARFLVTDNAGSLACPRGLGPDVVQYYTTPRYPAGRVVRVDVAALSQANAGQPVTIFFRSTDATSVLLLVNGSQLFAPVSVATSMSVLIGGEINTNATVPFSLAAAARVGAVSEEF